MSDKAEIIKLLGATFEAMGQQTTPAALALIADDVEPYGLAAVSGALVRCRRELSGRLTPAAILERIQSSDGRPEPNEAWSIALQGADERDTAVFNDEIAAALSAARDILAAGDEVGARMAFIECYKRVCREAREQNIPVRWWPSLGWDKTKQSAPIERAIEQGRLSRDHIASVYPMLGCDREPEMSFDRLLTGAVQNASDKEKAREVLNDLRSLFSSKHVEQ